MLDIIEQIDRIPTTYLKYIEGTNGLFEVRVQLGNNIFRIFCFFDGNKLVVLLSGFQKKTQKTPPEEIKRAERLMTDYYKEKEKEIYSIWSHQQEEQRGPLIPPSSSSLEIFHEALV